MDDPRVIDAIVILYILLRVVLILTISSILILKALVFRRAGKMGDAIAKSNVAMALAFVGTMLLLIGFDFFRTSPWILGISIAVMVYVVRAGRELANLYGSWKNVGREAWLTVLEIRDVWRVQRVGMKLAIVIYGLDLLAAIVLTEAKGTPKELVLPTMMAQPAPTPVTEPDQDAS